MRVVRVVRSTCVDQLGVDATVVVDGIEGGVPLLPSLSAPELVSWGPSVAMWASDNLRDVDPRVLQDLVGEVDDYWRPRGAEEDGQALEQRSALREGLER